METKELHELLTPIYVNDYPVERIRQLWENLQRCPYAFDDTTRGDAEYFAAQFFIPTNQFFEIGEMQGLACISGMQPGVNSALHFALWDEVKISVLLKAAKSLIELMFDGYELNRVTLVIPENNVDAKRLAVLLGFKPEGALRQCFKSEAIYYDLYFYGLLRSEFEQIRSF